ncbi:hypothetical protein [Vibrio anguillarum]|uniref:O-antigen ligase domain-containing protein n=1 Tax=Vibrio anguillarum TaxID=55601 RepID=A0ABD4QTC3_VIBAN|nr:hypothetical protein [Vibrio anguillarum]MBT2918462.1 hypothetical protein [Vibrio anguillarum]
MRNTNEVDFLLAYKSYFYIIILSFFCGKKFFHEDDIKKLYHFLLACFLVKYVVWHLVSDSDRPGLFSENNFEVLFLLLLTIAIYKLSERLSVFELTALTAIVFLSGSRSGSLAFLVMLIFLYIKEINFSTIIKLFLIGIISVGVGVIFISRMDVSNLESIDRFVFFQSLLLSIKDFSIIEYFWGTTPLTALPPVVCSQLSYYDVLFSKNNDGTCYSVVLHSYIMRTFYDHGIIGIIFLFYAINRFLISSKIDPRVRIATISIIFINGLSVSALNTVHCMLGLIIILSVYCEDDKIV